MLNFNSECKPTSVGSYSFAGCKSLTDMAAVVPESVKTIGERAFLNCEKLASVIIKPAVTNVNSAAFNGCTALKELTIEESETTLSLSCNYYSGYSTGGKGLFYDCPLNSVFIGRNLSYDTYGGRGYSPFANITTLTKARLGNPVKTIQDYLFYGCTSFTMLNFNSECQPTSVGNYAFYGCTSIVDGSDFLPSSVKTIGESVFRNCSKLENITVRSKVTSIGNNSFSGCSKLNIVFSWATTPPSINANCFDTDTYQSATLTVDPSSVNAYKNATGWKNFTNIAGGHVETTPGDVNADGLVSSVDVTVLYNYLLNNDSSALVNGDLDGDGVITAGDIVIIYNILLGNSGNNGNGNSDNGVQTFTVNGVSFKMVTVDGGSFMMGATSDDSEAGSNETPRHQVTLNSFAIGETEVTQELWQAVMGNNPSYVNGGSYGTNLKRPVENISWDDCQQFIAKLKQMTGKNFRLPTEAEWEYAARGGKKRHNYKYAGSDIIDDVAWYSGNTYSSSLSNYESKTVASKSPNELGLYDMSGNVWEWCQDWYGYYESSAATNPTGPTSGSSRICRGGAYVYPAESSRVTQRLNSRPSSHAGSLGLRLAL